MHDSGRFIKDFLGGNHHYGPAQSRLSASRRTEVEINNVTRGPLSFRPGDSIVDMAYDEVLADKVGSDLRRYDGVSERAMFGGIAFMVDGNMAVGVTGEDLMVRVGKESHDQAVSFPGVEAMSMGEREMRGWVRVTPDGMGSEGALEKWVDRGVAYARSLPPK